MATSATEVARLPVTDLDDFENEKVNLASTPAGPQGLKEQFRVWRYAVFWSTMISLTVIMESYDTILKNQFYAFPAFTRQFGVPNPNGRGFIIESKWQAALGSGVWAGMILGILLGTPLIDRFGYRWSMIIALGLNTAFIFPMFFATTIEIFFVGNILCALPWGIFATAAPAFAAEVAPKELRSYMVAWTNQCWVIGHILAAGLLKGMLPVPGQWSYRIPLALQWIWPVPIAIVLYFSPESPYHLVKKDRIEEAERAVSRLHETHAGIDYKAYTAVMVDTVRRERENRTGASYAACFRGTNLRRTEIATIAWISQAAVGFCVQSYATYFFTRAGMPPSQAFAIGLGNYCVAFVGNIGCWILLRYYGQRTIMLSGFAVMIPTMAIVGFLDLGNSTATRWTQAICLLVWFFWFGLTVGPIPYITASEVGAVQLRAKTIGIARIGYSVVFILNQILSPYMLTAWNLKGKAAFPAMGFTILLFIWGWFRLPEMSGKSFQELDELFHAGVSARNFPPYSVTRKQRADERADADLNATASNKA